MAIIPGFPGLRAEIIAGGNACCEYSESGDANEDTATSVTRYIEAKDGENFKIVIEFLSDFKYRDFDIMAVVTVDGQVVQKPIWLKKCFPHYKRTIEGVEADKGSGWKRRNFVFANLTTEPGDRVDSAIIEQAAKLGQITIAFRRVEVTNQIDDFKGQTWKEDTSKISEKALKGKAISRKAGVETFEVPMLKPNVYNHTDIDPPENPFAKFCFRYRSLNDLKAELIIPRSPSPLPLEDRPIEELTLEESRELLRRQRQDAARVKREMSRVKREHAHSISSEDEDEDDLEITDMRTKRRRVEIEPIDLTSD